MIPVLFALGSAPWMRPAPSTVALCVVAFLFLVGIGHFFWRSRHRSIATILFLISIPWGFAFALFVLDTAGIADPYGPEKQQPIFVDGVRGTIEPPFPTEQPRPTSPAVVTETP